MFEFFERLGDLFSNGDGSHYDTSGHESVVDGFGCPQFGQICIDNAAQHQSYIHNKSMYRQLVGRTGFLFGRQGV